MAHPAHTLNLWQYPEAADRNSLFIDVDFCGLSFTEGFSIGEPLEIRADYILPFVLPFSVGAFFKTPYPNLKSFGTRLGYHIDIDAPKTDIYVLYAFDFGFVRNDLLEEYGDEIQPIHYYDFRVGLRQIFRSYICISLETGFKLRGLRFALSIKIL